MEFTAEVVLLADRPITEKTLFDVAEIGGAAVGRPGERHLETTFTVTAANVHTAADKAFAMISDCVDGLIVAIEVMTTQEADRRAQQKWRLVGVSEIAGMLKISKQRVSTLSRRDDFPEPLARLESGPVWRAGDLSTFAAGWQRKAGRPRTRPEARSD